MHALTKHTLHAACLAVLTLCTACRAEPVSATPAQAEIRNYGHWQPVWLDKMQRLAQGENLKFRILQLGDSHTAGDSFTDSLRRRLQQEWGDGGIGWVYPDSVPGQRNLQVLHRSRGWKLLSSRNERADFPLGGIINRSNGGGQVSVSPRSPVGGVQNITLSARAVRASAPLTVGGADGTVAELPNLGDGWQYFTLNGELPLSYRAASGDIWEVGHINIENRQAGVVVSAMGINGAQFSHWQNWRGAWPEDLSATQADLVIIAYGTNEAFNSRLDTDAAARLWAENIARIREALPGAGILIVGAPESLKSRAGDCGTRPPMLDAVQAMQQQAAEQTQSLYWSWEAAMGGRCSMKNWIRQGLAAADGVHFSSQGYRRAGETLAEDLIRLAR